MPSGHMCEGARGLSLLYRQFGLTLRAHVAQIVGYLILLQAWIFGHFPMLMHVLNKSFKSDEHQALRWLSRRDTNVSIKHVKIRCSYFRLRYEAQ